MNERVCNQIAIAALVIMAVILAAHIAFPIQSPVTAIRALRKQETKLKSDINGLEDEIAATRATNLSRLWAQPADQVAAASMARVTELAKAQSLKILAFRPQRSQEDGGVVRYPYQISVEGYFPKLLAFVKSLETPKGKIPVVSVQIAAADGASDKVSSTIGIVAFKENEIKK